MKRIAKTRPYLKKYFSIFFFRKCEKCGLEFIREWGWEDLVTTSCFRAEHKYLCQDCAKTIIEAQDFFNNILCEKMKIN